MPCDVGWTHLYTVCSLMFWTLLQDHISPSVSYGGTIPVFCSNRNAGLLLAFPHYKVLKWTNSPVWRMFLHSQLCLSLIFTNQLSLHNTSCLFDQNVFSLSRSERECLGCSAFLGPYSWNACKRRRKGQMLYISGRLGLIPISCLIVKICNILISSRPKIFTAVTLRYNLIDWLKYLFKIPLLFPFNKDV